MNRLKNSKLRCLLLIGFSYFTLLVQSANACDFSDLRVCREIAKQVHASSVDPNRYVLRSTGAELIVLDRRNSSLIFIDPSKYRQNLRSVVLSNGQYKLGGKGLAGEQIISFEVYEEGDARVFFFLRKKADAAFYVEAYLSPIATGSLPETVPRFSMIQIGELEVGPSSDMVLAMNPKTNVPFLVLLGSEGSALGVVDIFDQGVMSLKLGFDLNLSSTTSSDGAPVFLFSKQIVFLVQEFLKKKSNEVLFERVGPIRAKIALRNIPFHLDLIEYQTNIEKLKLKILLEQNHIQGPASFWGHVFLFGIYEEIFYDLLSDRHTTGFLDGINFSEADGLKLLRDFGQLDQEQIDGLHIELARKKNLGKRVSFFSSLAILYIAQSRLKLFFADGLEGGHQIPALKDKLKKMYLSFYQKNEDIMKAIHLENSAFEKHADRFALKFYGSLRKGSEALSQKAYTTTSRFQWLKNGVPGFARGLDSSRVLSRSIDKSIQKVSRQAKLRSFRFLENEARLKKLIQTGSKEGRWASFVRHDALFSPPHFDPDYYLAKFLPLVENGYLGIDRKLKALDLAKSQVFDSLRRAETRSISASRVIELIQFYKLRPGIKVQSKTLRDLDLVLPESVVGKALGKPIHEFLQSALEHAYRSHDKNFYHDVLLKISKFPAPVVSAPKKIGFRSGTSGLQDLITQLTDLRIQKIKSQSSRQLHEGFFDGWAEVSRYVANMGPLRHQIIDKTAVDTKNHFYKYVFYNTMPSNAGFFEAVPEASHVKKALMGWVGDSFLGLMGNCGARSKVENRMEHCVGTTDFHVLKLPTWLPTVGGKGLNYEVFAHLLNDTLNWWLALPVWYAKMDPSTHRQITGPVSVGAHEQTVGILHRELNEVVKGFHPINLIWNQLIYDYPVRFMAKQLAVEEFKKSNPNYLASPTKMKDFLAYKASLQSRSGSILSIVERSLFSTFVSGPSSDPQFEIKEHVSSLLNPLFKSRLPAIFLEVLLVPYTSAFASQRLYPRYFGFHRKDLVDLFAELGRDDLKIVFAEEAIDIGSLSRDQIEWLIHFLLFVEMESVGAGDEGEGIGFARIKDAVQQTQCVLSNQLSLEGCLQLGGKDHAITGRVLLNGQGDGEVGVALKKILHLIQQSKTSMLQASLVEPFSFALDAFDKNIEVHELEKEVQDLELLADDLIDLSRMVALDRSLQGELFQRMMALSVVEGLYSYLYLVAYSPIRPKWLQLDELATLLAKVPKSRLLGKVANAAFLMSIPVSLTWESQLRQKTKSQTLLSKSAEAIASLFLARAQRVREKLLVSRFPSVAVKEERCRSLLAELEASKLHTAVSLEASLNLLEVWDKQRFRRVPAVLKQNSSFVLGMSLLSWGAYWGVHGLLRGRIKYSSHIHNYLSFLTTASLASWGGFSQIHHSQMEVLKTELMRFKSLKLQYQGVVKEKNITNRICGSDSKAKDILLERATKFSLSLEVLRSHQ